MNQESKKKVTILIVNFNSSDFIELSLYALRFLTKNDFQVFIVDNSSTKNDYKKLKKIVGNYDNVCLERIDTKLRGSLAHGTALNYLVKKINTPYFSILDADATWLKKDWDQILINKMGDKKKVLGTRATGLKPQDFPIMFAILFETKTFKKLNIDFRPKNIELGEDTGWELRKKYLEGGYEGENLNYFNTRNYKKGPFREVICGEYYLDENLSVFASHFGRGSSSSAGKYKKGNKRFLGNIPFIRGLLAKKIAKKEKKKWIEICKKIVDDQVLSKIKMETTPCDFCGSVDNKKLFSANVLYNQLPGNFSVVKCQKCNLVFTNPRPTCESMNFFYPEDTGYLKPKKPKEKKGISAKIYRIVLREYFGYFPEEKRSFVLKIILFPVFILKKNFLMTSGTPNFIKGGKLLDIGCSSGVFLSKMKKLGWKVRGVEPSKKASKYAKEKLNLDVTCSDIDSYQTNEKFDVITMRMVLEHVYSPTEVLKKVKSMLKENGLLIITVPNFSGFEARLYKNYAYTLQVPNHLFHFTPRTINKYLKKLGFDNFSFYYHVGTRDLLAPLSYIKNKGLFLSIFERLLKNKVVRFLVLTTFVKLMSFFRKTSRMTIFIRNK